MTDAAHAWNENGYYLERGVFSEAECDALIAHFMELRKTVQQGDGMELDPLSPDPLKRYPRMIHMHRWDAPSLNFGLDARLNRLMTSMLGVEPYLVQTMMYFKPAGARGQALHQDDVYLRTEPGKCLAAWLALDDCDEENGCLQIVPGTQDLPVMCTVEADITQSFSNDTVPLPDGLSAVPVTMRRGDVLFFNGSLVHGSYPNVTKDRFRRSLIGHYVTGAAEKVAEFYHPALRMDGTEVTLGVSDYGGQCGEWVDLNGVPEVALVGRGAHDRMPKHE